MPSDGADFLKKYLRLEVLGWKIFVYPFGLRYYLLGLKFDKDLRSLMKYMSYVVYNDLNDGILQV